MVYRNEHALLSNQRQFRDRLVHWGGHDPHGSGAIVDDALS